MVYYGSLVIVRKMDRRGNKGCVPGSLQHPHLRELKEGKQKKTSERKKSRWDKRFAQSLTRLMHLPQFLIECAVVWT